MVTSLVPSAEIRGEAAEAAGRATGAQPGAVEVPERRTRTSATYRNPDGSFTTSVFVGPINYRDTRGRWQPIESELEREAVDGYAWTNRANSFRVRFKEELGDNESPCSRLAGCEPATPTTTATGSRATAPSRPGWSRICSSSPTTRWTGAASAGTLQQAGEHQRSANSVARGAYAHIETGSRRQRTTSSSHVYGSEP
jgi:hypothetical protein